MCQEVADETAVIFVVDASEEFGAELLYCLWSIEWQLLILCAATKVAGHTPGLKYGFDLSIEVYARIETHTPARLPVYHPSITALLGTPVWGRRIADF